MTEQKNDPMAIARLQLAHLWDAPPVVLEYLRTGNESLRAAAKADVIAAARGGDPGGCLARCLVAAWVSRL